MEQKRIDKIRVRLDRWNEGHTDNEILSEASGIIQRVPDLLDALEAAQALLSKSADRTAWLIEENERLRGNDTEWTDEIREAVEALEGKYDIEIVSISFCVGMDDARIKAQAQSARMRKALRQIERPSMTLHHHGNIVGGDGPSGRFVVLGCCSCDRDFTLYNDGRRRGRHESGCPFKILENTALCHGEH